MTFADRIQSAWAALTGKQISHHPELRYRVHVLRQEAGTAVQRELEAFSDYADVYQSYVWVHKAVSLIATAAQALPDA